MTVRFGFDFGRVVTEFLQGEDPAKRLASGTYLNVRPYPDVLRVLPKAVVAFGAQNVACISRCGPVVQRMTRNWLEHWQFADRTGFDMRNLHFTTTCAGKAVLVRDVDMFPGGLTHFLDDSLTVLGPMEGIVRHRMLFGKPPSQTPPGFVSIRDWNETEEYLGLV